jgi:hypothetical protein
VLMLISDALKTRCSEILKTLLLTAQLVLVQVRPSEGKTRSGRELEL